MMSCPPSSGLELTTVHPKYAKSCCPKTWAIFWWTQATYSKPQVCLYLHCTKKATLLYTRCSSFSKGVYFCDTIHQRLVACVHPKLVPTTLNESTITRKSGGWSCWCEKPLDNSSMLCVSFIFIYSCNVSQYLCAYYDIHNHTLTSSYLVNLLSYKQVTLTKR